MTVIAGLIVDDIITVIAGLIVDDIITVIAGLTGNLYDLWE